MCHISAPGRLWGRNLKKRHKLKDNFFIRIDNPERNNFLKAPLAKKAGVTQKCGQAVFKDKNDPDYKKIMAGFNALQQKLNKRPRFDMMKLEDQKAKCRDNECNVVKSNVR